MKKPVNQPGMESWLFTAKMRSARKMLLRFKNTKRSSRIPIPSFLIAGVLFLEILPLRPLPKNKP